MKRAWMALVVALIAIAAAVGLYFLVAQPQPAENAYFDSNAPHEVHWHSWSNEAFQKAQDNERLVFLLVANPRVPAASELQKEIEAHPALSVLLANRLVPVVVDRRVRPDIAERYAEDLPFQAMILLPTGEALMVLEGEPDDWPKEITETDRYWRDHREDIQSRIESFWAEYEESLKQHRAPREPQKSDLEIIDRHVRELAEAAIENAAMGIWRMDVSEYLMLRSETEPWAGALRQQLYDVRGKAWNENANHIMRGSIEVLYRFFLDRYLWRESHPQKPGAGGEVPFATELDRQASESKYHPTASEVASVGMWGQGVESFPGSWLNPDGDSEYALPHNWPAVSELDGYLIDALAWLECFSRDTSGTAIRRASALADSIWANLWSPEANALRDKPLRDTPVREIELFPRPQLGRAATLFDALADQSGDVKYRHRADSCLAGFAPYVEDAGAAAAYYGIALLKRFHKGS